MPNPVSFPLFHVTDPATGMPLAGGLVWTENADTNNPQDTWAAWTPSGGYASINTNPIVLNSDGNATIFCKLPTKLIIEGPPPIGNPHGTVLFTIPRIEPAPYNSYLVVGAVVPPTPGSNQIGIYCSGTTLYLIDSTGAITSPATSQAIQQQVYVSASGGGTGDAITATLTPAITSLVDKTQVCIWSTSANTTTTPTFSPNGLTPKTIVKNNNQPLAVGDIPGSNYPIQLIYNVTLDKWIYLDPVSPSADAIHKVASVTISAESTKILSSSLTSGSYKLIFNLTQNTAPGVPSLKINNDSGNNCTCYQNFLDNANYQIPAASSNWPLTYTPNAADAATKWYATVDLICSGNTVMMFANSTWTTTSMRMMIMSGNYAGAAPLSRLDLTASGGTMTGTVTIYRMP